MMNEHMNALSFRHVCKRFNPSRKIPKTQMEQLLEIVFLSPSSFGVKPWRLVVVRSSKAKTALRALCRDQSQITECSDLVIFTTERLDANETLLENWMAKQYYIAEANMMSGAAVMQIDSCPIKEFDKEKVEAFLELDDQHSVALMVAFGYRSDPEQKQTQQKMENIVTYL